VERVRDDARLRRELARFLDAHATELRELSPLEIGTRAQTELGVAKASVTAPSGRSPRERPRLAVAAWAGLTLTGLRAALADVIDFVRELWLDTSVRLERAPGAGSTAPLGAQRCFSHVARVKPGRFRRAALRLALRALAALSFAATAAGGSEGTRSILAARWVLLDDGRLVFLANHDGSLRAALGAFALRASALVGMVWSQTLGFPRSFGWFAGGARDELGLAAFAAAGELSTPLWYSAYPELGADEMRANAEIRALLAGDLDAPGAARLLALVRD
ncbi:MAG TPA: hypothetical protein VMI54_24425, partial [Polyangiaceae bacterium]|nr:hypothetical protein [Polyangiaceae bacterium]